MIHLLFVLLFLFRVRRSRCQNLPEYLRVKYGHATLLSYRRLETSLRKQKKADLDLEFLLYCKLNNVVPNFIKFKLYRRSLHHSVFYHEATEKLLDMEIRYKERLAKKHEQTTVKLFNVLCNSLTFLDCILFKHYVNRNLDSYELDVKRVHERKLQNLGIIVPSNSITTDRIEQENAPSIGFIEDKIRS